MLYFHHLGASTKAAPAIGAMGVRTPRTWNNFPKMNGIFWQKWTFLSPPWLQGEIRYGSGRGAPGKYGPPRCQICNTIPISCPFQKFQIHQVEGQNEWNLQFFFWVIFWRENFFRETEKWGLGIGRGLWHRKVEGVPKNLNRQSPQPNPHTFFFTLNWTHQKLNAPHYIFKYNIII